MTCDARGGFKGCQHHLRTVTQCLIQLVWVTEKSDTGLTMNQYLGYVYFINDTNMMSMIVGIYNVTAKQP